MLSATAVVSSIARASLRGPARHTAVRAAFTTYSGGQPTEGQGGFYGSIKSRSEKNAVFQPGSRAEPTDVAQLQHLMDHWAAVRASLPAAGDEDAAWKELTAESEHAELLKRLVVKGAPVWGLSVHQREFVAKFMARTSSA
jgi:hypothetical protein